MARRKKVRDHTMLQNKATEIDVKQAARDGTCKTSFPDCSSECEEISKMLKEQEEQISQVADPSLYTHSEGETTIQQESFSLGKPKDSLEEMKKIFNSNPEQICGIIVIDFVCLVAFIFFLKSVYSYKNMRDRVTKNNSNHNNNNNNNNNDNSKKKAYIHETHVELKTFLKYDRKRDVVAVVATVLTFYCVFSTLSELFPDSKNIQFAGDGFSDSSSVASAHGLQNSVAASAHAVRSKKLVTETSSLVNNKQKSKQDDDNDEEDHSILPTGKSVEEIEDNMEKNNNNKEEDNNFHSFLFGVVKGATGYVLRSVFQIGVKTLDLDIIAHFLEIIIKIVALFLVWGVIIFVLYSYCGRDQISDEDLVKVTVEATKDAMTFEMNDGLHLDDVNELPPLSVTASSAATAAAGGGGVVGSRRNSPLLQQLSPASSSATTSSPTASPKNKKKLLKNRSLSPVSPTSAASSSSPVASQGRVPSASPEALAQEKIEHGGEEESE